mmetsp:Transcript_10329/g.15129  ORF Transcript_10329/g.15129 Transcript_10329/m.15129 type:complete len:587 (-) Transcript_10329:115-1875(-)
MIFPKMAFAGMICNMILINSHTSEAFGGIQPKNNHHHKQHQHPSTTFSSPIHPHGHPIVSKTSSRRSSSSTTSLHMVFDFFKQRASEGVEQLSSLTDKAKRGKLGEGLSDIAVYTQESNAAFAKGLAKSRTKFLYDLDAVVNNAGRDFLDDLEDILLQSDLGMATTEDVIEEVKYLRDFEDAATFFSREDLRSILRGKLLEALEPAPKNDGEEDGANNRRAIRFANPDASKPEDKLTVLFFMGANGMGKTTTIGKLAHRLRSEGSQKILLAACDTFRAGAVDQLELWADRSEVDCFSPSTSDSGSGTSKATSPSAVLYGALDKALKEEYDTLIVDTSGRLANNDALTAELLKMKKVIQKRLADPPEQYMDGSSGPITLNENVPHETLLVIDAAQGRMALDSARQWHKEVGISGLVLTKLDGSAKGGSVVAVSRELQLPVKLVGVGEALDDLRDFDPESFVDGLLGIGQAGGTKGSPSKAAVENEGKMLASRLAEMRKTRDERAKQMNKSSPSSAPTQPGIMGGMPSEAEMMQMMEADSAASSDNHGGITMLTSDDDDGASTSKGGAPVKKKKNSNKKKKKKKKGKR